MRKINKKGQIPIGLAKPVFLGFLSLVIIALVVLVAMSAIRSSSILPAGSDEANITQSVAKNVGAGISQFFGATGTIFAILLVVVIVGGLILLLVYVTRATGGNRGGMS